jgi:alkylhydroperoxidase family enzyme
MAMVNTTTDSVARDIKAEAKVSGLRGVFLRLVQEHGELTALLLRLKMNSSAALRAELFPALREALLSHERAEAEVVYAAMGRKHQTSLIAAKHRRTGSEIERLVEQLSAIEYVNPLWDGTFARLFEAVEQHTIEEESYYFPIAQRVLGESKTHALRAHYDAVRASRGTHNQ